jgi:proteasome lid subunit RPN8/RPN11
MIVWTEQKPDFARRPIDTLLVRLPFTTACALALPNTGALKVLANGKVMDGILAHLQERNIEMGGLLLGGVYDELPGRDGLIVAVTDFAKSTEFDGTHVSLKMDPDVWERARLQSNGTRVVVGWYHSHPNLGVFFSGTDRKTQRAFFNHPHSLGLVIDPIRLEEMWFVGSDSIQLNRSHVLRHFE